MSELVIDPDCRDGKHTACVGGPCECFCHAESAEIQRIKDWRRRVEQDAERTERRLAALEQRVRQLVDGKADA